MMRRRALMSVEKKQPIQILQNGNFANGTEHWYPTPYMTIRAENNSLILTNGKDSTRSRRAVQDIALIVGHKYLAITSITSLVSVQRYAQFVVGEIATTRKAVQPQQTVYYASVVSYDTAVSNPSFGAGFYSSGMASYSDAFSLKNTMLVDLTATYGAGNEPTREQFKQDYPDEAD